MCVPKLQQRMVENRVQAAAQYSEDAQLCAGHAQQLGGESPPANLMEVKA
jgi:hypothetical protein